MITQFHSAAVSGLVAQCILVEAEVVSGMSLFTIVGLPDTRVQEARERIRCAIKQSGLKFPYNFRITVNLAPADVRKIGTAFDVPIALAILGRELALPPQPNALFLGELALDGTIRSVRGVLSAALAAQKMGITELFVPAENAAEAALVEGLTIYPTQTLATLLNHVREHKALPPFVRSTQSHTTPTLEIDFADIAHNVTTKRALEIAATGNHHVLLSGPPGVGKTMLARALPGILPPLSQAESIEVTQIYSAAGIVTPQKLPIRTRPFRSPHHSASAAALLGGGNTLKPGELALAHNGVLFLDEFPEFQRTVLEQLRQPLEQGELVVARAEATVCYPTRFLLVAAQNPCPCGFSGSMHQECRCTGVEKLRYSKKISGPIIDRIDMFSTVPETIISEFANHKKSVAESSSVVRARVTRAHAFLNSLPIDALKLCNTSARTMMIHAAEKLHLSARSFVRLGRVSRTIAALENATEINTTHVAEAIQYRFIAHT